MALPGTVHWLKAILEVSWQGSLVIVLILLVRPLLGLRVPARWRYLLWTFVLLRLLVPALLLPPQSGEPAKHPRRWTIPSSRRALPSIDLPRTGCRRWTGVCGGRRPSRTPPSTFRRRPPKRSSHFPWWQFAAGFWLAGMVALGLWILITTLRLRRRLERDPVPVDPTVRDIWERCCRSLVIRRPPRLLASPRVDSPALIGLFRPVLLIPIDASLSAGDWEHIFMHELAHCRRFDDWTQALQLLALCVHWFNPLVWLGFRCLRADRELAADEWALQHLSGRAPVDYADTLLKILTSKSDSAAQPAAVGIMEDRSHLQHRLERIVAFGPRKLAGSIAGVLVLLVLAVVVLAKPASHADLSGFAGLTPPQILVIAAHNGDQPVLQQLLDDGVDVNSVSDLPGEHTALAAAAAANQMEIVRLLLVKGADVNLKPANGETPVVAAWKQGWTACGDYLLGKGATCEADILAAARGDTPAVQTVIAAGQADATRLKLLADIAAANGHAVTYLALADGIKQLPGQGRWQPADGAPVVAIARGHRDVVEAMIQRGSGLNKVGWVRLAGAAAQTAGMRDWLISKGYKVAEYSDGERLIDAVEREDLAEIRRLVKAGVDVNYRGLGKDDWTPLTRAAEGGRPKAVKLLLELGANPNLVRSPGWGLFAVVPGPDHGDRGPAAGRRCGSQCEALPARRPHHRPLRFVRAGGNGAVVHRSRRRRDEGQK
ncbi:MAG: M56 family metallopeptidase [Chthoniobacter sp.]